MYRNLTRFAALIITIVSTGPGQSRRIHPRISPRPRSRITTELSKLLHRVVTANVQKEVENRSNGARPFVSAQAAAADAKKRTVVRVGDHDELPHGPWRRPQGLDSTTRPAT